jgi:hypothetical protein
MIKIIFYPAPLLCQPKPRRRLALYHPEFYNDFLQKNGKFAIQYD